MSAAGDAVAVLTADHRRIEELFGRYESASDPAERTRIVHEVIHDLAVHGEIEELLLYPRIRRLISGGEKLADESIDEHLEIKRTLNALDRMTADDDGFDERMGELMQEVRHHVEEEERDLFPRLREAMPADELDRLGRSLTNVKAFVPTRPHPAAPTGPIGKLATSAPVALVDRVRDSVRKWRDESRS